MDGVYNRAVYLCCNKDKMSTDNTTDDIELSNLGKDSEAADQSDQGSKDTNVDDDDLLSGDPNESINVMSSGGNPDYYSEVSGDIFMDTLLNSPDDITRYDDVGLSRWRLNMLRDLKVKEKILDKVYGVKFRGRYGEKTRSLLKSLRVKRASKTANETGLEFTNPDEVRSGKKKYKDVIIGYSTGKLKESTGGGVTDGYKRLVEEGKKEYYDNSLRAETERAERRSAAASATASTPKAKTTATDKNESANEGASTSTAKNTTTTTTADKNEKVNEGASTSTATNATTDEDTESPVTDDVMDEVMVKLLRELRNLIDTDREMVENLARRMGKSEAEIRETDTATSANILDQNLGDTAYSSVSKILKTNIDHWKNKLKEADASAMEKELYDRALRTSEHVKDYIRVKNELKPETKVAKELLKEAVGGSDQLRLERFKKWVKKNAVGISGVAITVAALITGVVMGARNALVMGARGLGKFAGAVARVFKKLGPLFSALGTVISTALSFGAKGILWLANNMWILAIALAAVVYNKYITK